MVCIHFPYATFMLVLLYFDFRFFYMGKRHDRSVGNRARAQTNKIVSKLTYSPKKHKNRKVRQMRERLQQQKPIEVMRVLEPKAQIKFGSFNVNGSAIFRQGPSGPGPRAPHIRGPPTFQSLYIF